MMANNSNVASLSVGLEDLVDGVAFDGALSLSLCAPQLLPNSLSRSTT